MYIHSTTNIETSESLWVKSVCYHSHVSMSQCRLSLVHFFQFLTLLPSILIKNNVNAFIDRVYVGFSSLKLSAFISCIA